ncbi:MULTISPECIES: acyltransferase [unclassified Luteimonas]|uniref:LpxL/LpxP family acyltransferase n=1 Tax=unclassified Luteimonas TaxID=2629088 RepID=UPI0018F0963F|nr:MULTISPECIES: acyltransferase [unclassified Luteimonas]MBJ6979081.1 acyltransferase [Luteimonas sp. MC1895]MBJ6985097.1 acyltransferase [Luteimonas sp. MC1750]QQO05756.1 acyltransferase [Luteimonas sp. MC1750]
MTGDWKQRREGGRPFALRLLSAVSLRGGRRLARLLLYPITGYFMARRGEERRDSRAYLSRVLGRPARLSEVARHIHTFAATILDRVFLLGGDMRRFDIRVSGLDSLHDALDQGRGVLVFGSHLGSFEVLRVLGRQRPDQQIRVVLDKAHSPAVTELLDALNPEIANSVIDASQDGPAIMFEIQKAASEGALVALLVDRTQPGEPSLAVPFLGDAAHFPVAPWLLASVLQVPVQLAFGLYRGGNRYDLGFEPFSDGLAIPRRERAAAVPALIARYAARLEHHVRDAPYNWFNFYDFWGDREHSRSQHDPTPPAAAPGPVPASPAGLAAGRAAGGDGDAAVRRAAGGG